MVTSEELESTFKKVGNDFGFNNVKAAYAPFRDLKIRWQRTGGWASFEVSDYFEKAPGDVIEGLARTLMGRIRGEDSDYPADTIEWLSSHEFRIGNQSTYIERSRMIAKPEDDGNRLLESYERLLKGGFISEIEDLRMFWSKSAGSRKTGESSCQMRVVIMNPGLRGDDVPDEVLDYCLMHQLANIEAGFGIDRERRIRKVSSMMDAFPGASEMHSWVKKMGMEMRSRRGRPPSVLTSFAHRRRSWHQPRPSPRS